MSLRATLDVILGCNFGAASRLLAASEAGEEAVVQQVVCDKPQLAAFAGYHGTVSPLHRAAAAGHLGVCRAIIEPLKARVRAAEAGGGGGGGAARWRRLLATVLNQRSHKSLTPLMLACEHGHAGVAAYLLREGADPLAADFIHSRTCLHYAAVGGHADCLRLLCSDLAMVPSPDGARPLRDVIVSDVQVQACRFIDQRAFGGLTALHFAVVTGNLDAVQALLRAGASIMVKSDGEAYIGEDFLVPGSTPLHVAVIIQNISIVHAILQAHMEMMNILGTHLDERGRRPWEGTSRTDIRSVRNHFRKLPFHLARERHQPALMSLVDPRIPVDVALDAARDTEHGIGAKRLSTICALVLQRSLLQWLDDCQGQLAREAAAKAAAAAAADAARRAEDAAAGAAAPPPAPGQPPLQAALAVLTGGRQKGGGSSSRPPLPGGSLPPSNRSSAGAAAEAGAPAAAGADAAAPAAVQQQQQQQTEGGRVLVVRSGSTADMTASPFARLAGLAAAPAAGDDAGGATPHRLPISASAPTTPARDLAALAVPRLPTSEGAVAGLDAASTAGGGDDEGSLHRMASLHGYMGMLATKRPHSQRSLDALRGLQVAQGRGGGARALQRQLSGTAAALERSSASATPPSGAQTARVRFLTDPAAAAGGDAELLEGSPASAPGSPTDLTAAAAAAGAGGDLLGGDRRILLVPQHRRASSQGGTNMRLGGVLGNLRDRLRSGELPAAFLAGDGPLGGGAVGGAGGAAAGTALLGEKHSEKDLALDSEGEPGSPSSQDEEDGEDVECGVCLDAVVEVAFAACQHKLCLECARNLTRQNKKPPHCPFCRRLVVGFQRVSAAPGCGAEGGSSRCATPKHRSVAAR